jgi:hypothetical protein
MMPRKNQQPRQTPIRLLPWRRRRRNRAQRKTKRSASLSGWPSSTKMNGAASSSTFTGLEVAHMHRDLRDVLAEVEREPLTVPTRSERTKQEVDLKVGAFLLQFAVKDIVAQWPEGGSDTGFGKFRCASRPYASDWDSTGPLQRFGLRLQCDAVRCVLFRRLVSAER